MTMQFLSYTCRYLVGRQLVNYSSSEEEPVDELEYSVPVQETH